MAVTLVKGVVALPPQFGQGMQVFYARPSTNITYQTSNYASGTAGTMRYAVHIRLEYLG